MRAAIALVIALFSVPAAASSDRVDRQRTIAEVSDRFENDGARQLAVDALTSMLTVAAAHLQKRDRSEDAEQMLGEWETIYRDRVAGVAEDVGDHLPYSEWLQVWYAVLEAEFGVQFMEWTHLRDIWILNFAMPVVFSPDAQAVWCREHLQDHPNDSCKREYARHFVGTKFGAFDPLNHPDLHHGFAGVVSYWLAWAACQYATAGTGWFVVCTPVGTLVENAVERRIAPRVSDRIWDRTNPI